MSIIQKQVIKSIILITLTKIRNISMSHLNPTGTANVYQYQKKDGSPGFYPYIGRYCLGTFDTLDAAVKRRDTVKAERKELAEKRKAIKKCNKGALA